MEQTWRWFGDADPISLDHVKQTGATGVVTSLHHVPVGQKWTNQDIENRKNDINAAGLDWSVCESIPVPDSIKRGDEHSGTLTDIWKDNLALLGRAGVPVVCYNFMPVVDWTRTDLQYELPSGGHALRFDLIDFIVYDLFVLDRQGAELSYASPLIEKAQKRAIDLTLEDKTQLEFNIIKGLPGGADPHTRQSLKDLIATFDGLAAADLRNNLFQFLREIVPVAQDVGVRLAIHPDDPPISLFGLPRVVSTAEDARRILSAVEHPANGLTMCVGSYGSRPDNDVLAMTREFAQRINFAHLRNVAMQPDGSFYEAEHLRGDTDMVGVIELLLREEKDAHITGRRNSIPMRPDHGHLLADDINKKTNAGYSYIGRLKGLAELRGVIQALERRSEPTFSGLSLSRQAAT